MTIAFLSLFASTLGERVDMRLGRLLLVPLLITGILSVVYWRTTGDLRLYAIVQFLPMIAVPAMLLLFPPRHSGSQGVWAMAGLYALAKVVELLDQPIGTIVASGGHPWKHVIAAVAVFAYASSVSRRQPI